MKEFGWAIVDQHGEVEAYTLAQDEIMAWAFYIAALDDERPVDELKALGCRAIRVRLVEVGPA